MKEFWKKADEFVFISSAIGPWTWLVTVVIIVAIFKSCFTHGPDPVNESINKSAEIVDHIMVLDSTKNGFRVTYATAEPVTNEKFVEIAARQEIKEGFERLKKRLPSISGEICWRPISAILPYMPIASTSMMIFSFITSLWRVKRRWISMCARIQICQDVLHGCIMGQSKATNISIATISITIYLTAVGFTDTGSAVSFCNRLIQTSVSAILRKKNDCTDLRKSLYTHP